MLKTGGLYPSTNAVPLERVVTSLANGLPSSAGRAPRRMS
jgi:hypothetical protein